MKELQLREFIPQVIASLCRRGADFTAAEDAVQEALLELLKMGDTSYPDDVKGWLITVAWRKYLDGVRADSARRGREERADASMVQSRAVAEDDTLELYFLCAHPSLTATSAVSLTLRAVAGLTTRQIARAYLVPEATMAQRISRAKRIVAEERFNQPGDLSRVLRVLYLVFNEGYASNIDLAAEAIRLTRQLATRFDHPEVAGLHALMLLHHARRQTRTDDDGSLVPLAKQDRQYWDNSLIVEGIELLQRALADNQLGQYQIQAAIAALHADAPDIENTDWEQIVEWYDELVALTQSPIVQLNRAVALGHANGAEEGLAALHDLDPDLPRYTGVEAYLTEQAGDLNRAAHLYTDAAKQADNLAERDHLIRQAARLNATDFSQP